MNEGFHYGALRPVIPTYPSQSCDYLLLLNFKMLFAALKHTMKYIYIFFN